MLGIDLFQCPECGRWVCDYCWSADKDVCSLCSKTILSLQDYSKELSSEIKRLEKRIGEIESYIRNLNSKIGQIKLCPSCGFPMSSKNKHCGMCGTRLVSLANTSSNTPAS